MPKECFAPPRGWEASSSLATLGRTIGRKGVVRGALDTALDFIPFVGGLKNAAEIARGRDFFPDRPRPR